jgi:hypothetical protein
MYIHASQSSITPTLCRAYKPSVRQECLTLKSVLRSTALERCSDRIGARSTRTLRQIHAKLLTMSIRETGMNRNRVATTCSPNIRRQRVRQGIAEAVVGRIVGLIIGRMKLEWVDSWLVTLEHNTRIRVYDMRPLPYVRHSFGSIPPGGRARIRMIRNDPVDRENQKMRFSTKLKTYERIE